MLLEHLDLVVEPHHSQQLTKHMVVEEEIEVVLAVMVVLAAAAAVELCQSVVEEMLFLVAVQHQDMRRFMEIMVVLVETQLVVEVVVVPVVLVGIVLVLTQVQVVSVVLE